jgi:hypothetical protein
VVATNGQRLFKFENTSVGNHGHFSVKYLFPDDGIHQVITRLDTKDSSTAAPFNVFVPRLAPPTILNPFPSSLSSSAKSDNNQQIGMTAIVVAVIITGAAVLTVFIMKRKQKYPPNKSVIFELSQIQK